MLSYLEESFHLVGLHDAALFDAVEVESTLEDLLSVVGGAEVSQQERHVGAVGREEKVASQTGVVLLAPAKLTQHLGAEGALRVGQSLRVQPIALGHGGLGSHAFRASAARKR